MLKKGVLKPEKLATLRFTEVKTLHRPGFVIPRRFACQEQIMQYAKDQNGRWWLTAVTHLANTYAEQGCGRQARMEDYTVPNVVLNYPAHELTPIRVAVDGLDFRTEIVRIHPEVEFEDSAIDVTMPTTTYIL